MPYFSSQYLWMIGDRECATGHPMTHAARNSSAMSYTFRDGPGTGRRRARHRSRAVAADHGASGEADQPPPPSLWKRAHAPR
jgi:hypothetical protein